MDRLAEISQYNSAFRNALTDEDFLAAGYTPEEISAYRGQITTPGLTQQDLTEMQSLYGNLEAPDYTIREAGTNQVQDALMRKWGLDPYEAGSYARRIMGDPNASGILESIGLADLTPVGALFGVEEGSGTAIRGYQQGDPIAMGLGAVEAGLGLAEAFPLTKTIARGLERTVQKMDPNTLYSVFGPPIPAGGPSPLRAPVRAPETGGGSSALSSLSVTRRDASNIFGEGTERVRYTDPQSGGTIEVVARPDGSASVLELEVPEEFRGQGIGQRLQERVMQDFPMMGGQVSSKAAATTAYRLGRRPPGQPDATLDEVFAMIDDMSSVNLVSPEMQSRFGGTAAPTGFRAFHGSPYEFESFDFSKMGTGEGAQAYGRGGYFASEADVARGYRPAGDLMVGKKSVSDIYDSISSRADRLPPKAAEAEYNKMAVLEDLMGDGDVLAVRERAAGGAYDQATMDWFEKEIVPNFKGSGSLYEVNIRANPEEFLDWEKPLSEQPKAVLEALDPFIQEKIDSIVAAGERGRQIAKEKGLPDFTPKSREQVFAQLRGGDIAASGRLGQSSFSEDVLKEAGVPGIKYLDPQSRSQNYVVFDQNLIDIVKKYGIAGAATILGVSALDVEQAIAANVPQSEWDQLVAGPR